MSPPRPRGVERPASVAILAVAVAIAFWIADNPTERPRDIAMTAPVPDLIPPDSAPEDAPLPRAIELIDLADLALPEPLPSPALAAVAPTPVTPPPLPHEASPEPIPVSEPPQVVPLQATPAAPAPVVVALRPTDPRPRPTPAIAPLVPETTRSQEKEIVPLRAAPPPPLPPPRVAAAPRPAAAPKPVTAPIPRRASPPSPPAARPAPDAPSVNIPAIVGEGRALLRILEQGAGPGIEIGWPSDARGRDRLYDILVRCLGMRTGVLDSEGRLYMADGRKGQPSVLDAERYSGFVRRPEGAMAKDEQGEVARVRAFHRTAAASPARIFPRRVDAFLIGGLRQVVGENYLRVKSIRAAYRLRGGKVVVDSITADGRTIPGMIDLSMVFSGCGF